MNILHDQNIICMVNQDNVTVPLIYLKDIGMVTKWFMWSTQDKATVSLTYCKDTGMTIIIFVWSQSW